MRTLNVKHLLCSSFASFVISEEFSRYQMFISSPNGRKTIQKSGLLARISCLWPDCINALPCDYQIKSLPNLQSVSMKTSFLD